MASAAMNPFKTMEKNNQMRKSLFSLGLLLVVFLTACGQMTPPGAGQPASSTQAVPQSACRVTSRAQVDPTQVAQFPNVSNQEWSMGAPDAEVTIIEYGDFQ
jgi:hypothetical protein